MVEMPCLFWSFVTEKTIFVSCRLVSIEQLLTWNSAQEAIAQRLQFPVSNMKVWCHFITPPEINGHHQNPSRGLHISWEQKRAQCAMVLIPVYILVCQETFVVRYDTHNQGCDVRHYSLFSLMSQELTLFALFEFFQTLFIISVKFRHYLNK